MDAKLIVAVDPELLAADIAALLAEKEQCQQYLNLCCGDKHACEVILSASSMLVANKNPAAHRALSEADAETADVLLRFVYGEEVEIEDEGMLKKLFALARGVGVETCIDKCRYEMLHADFLSYPIKLRTLAHEKRQQFVLLQRFKRERRFADVTLCSKHTDFSDSLWSPVFEELLVHGVVLAAASKYFATRWKHGFEDGSGSVFNVDATALQVELLIRAVYGESIELCVVDLVDLFLLADRWQVSRLSKVILAHLKKHLTPDLIEHILTKLPEFPKPILHLVFITIGPQLHVTAPAHQNLEGTYKYACSFANAQPVWHQENGTFLLYSDPNGHWCFCSKDVAERDNFQSAFCLLVSQYPHEGQMPHEMDRCWKSYNGYDYIHDRSVVIADDSKKSPFLLHDILSEHVGLAVQILSGTILRSIGYAKRVATIWVKRDNNLQKLVASSEWLQLDVDKVAILYLSLFTNENVNLLGSHWKDTLDIAVVNWARKGAPSANHAMVCLLELIDCCLKAITCEACQRMVTDLEFKCINCDGVKNDSCRQMLTSWTRQLMQVCGDDALSLVEQILGQGWSRTFKTSSSGIASNAHGVKRLRDGIDGSSSAILEVVAGWSTPRLKRLRIRPAWSTVRPEALVAILRFEKASIGEVGDQSRVAEHQTEMKAAARSWVQCATLPSILEVIGQLGTSTRPDIFEVLLAGARLKAGALQEQADALSKAQKAQNDAEQKVARMEQQFKAAESKAKDFKAKLTAMLEEHCPFLDGKPISQ